MITLSKSGGTVTFTFDGNSTYLQNGTIEVPLNSLSLIVDESGMATFRKSASNDIFVSALYSEFGMTKAELEAWYKENMVGSTGGGGGGISSGEAQTMIDESISGLAESSAVTLEISEAVSGKADADSLATVATSGSYDDLTNKPTIPTVPTSNTAFTNDAGYITSNALNGYATEQWVGEQGYITGVDLSNYATLQDIPSVTPYADSVKYNSTSKYVEFYHGGTGGTKVFEYDASPFLIDGMVQNVEIKNVPLTEEATLTTTVTSYTFNSGATSEAIVKVTDGWWTDSQWKTTFLAFDPGNCILAQDNGSIFLDNGTATNTGNTIHIQTNSPFTNVYYQGITNLSYFESISAVYGSQTCLVISFNTDAGKQDINIPLSDIFNPENYYDKDAVDGIVSGINEDIAAAVSGKQDTLVAGSGIIISGNVISAEAGTVPYDGYSKVEIFTGDTWELDKIETPFYVVSGSHFCFEYQGNGEQPWGDYTCALLDWTNHTSSFQEQGAEEYISVTWDAKYSAFKFDTLQDGHNITHVSGMNNWGYGVDIVPSGTTNETFDNVIEYMIDSDKALDSKFGNYLTISGASNTYLAKADSAAIKYSQGMFESGQTNISGIVAIQNGFEHYTVAQPLGNSDYPSSYGKGIFRESFLLGMADALYWVLWKGDEYPPIHIFGIPQEEVFNGGLVGRKVFVIWNGGHTSAIYFKCENATITTAETQIDFSLSGKIYYDEECTKQYKTRPNWSLQGSVTKDGEVNGYFSAMQLEMDGFFGNKTQNQGIFYDENGNTHQIPLIFHTYSTESNVYKEGLAIFTYCLVNQNISGNYYPYAINGSLVSNQSKRFGTSDVYMNVNVSLVDYSKLSPLGFEYVVNDDSTDNQGTVGIKYRKYDEPQSTFPCYVGINGQGYVLVEYSEGEWVYNDESVSGVYTITVDGDGYRTLMVSDIEGHHFISHSDMGSGVVEIPTTYYVHYTNGTSQEGITSGEVQTMIDSSISGKADTTAVTQEISSAVSGKQDTLISGTNIKTVNNQSLLGSGNITIQGGGGGGTTYSAGTGINIDSANTITATYRGYLSFDNPQSDLSQYSGEFYIKAPWLDCIGQETGNCTIYTAEFSGDYQYGFSFNPTTKQYTVTEYPQDKENDWQNYFTITFDEGLKLFKVTTLQQIAYLFDNGCTRFFRIGSGYDDYSFKYSGTTEQTFDDVFDKFRKYVNQVQMGSISDQLQLSCQFDNSANSTYSAVRLEELDGTDSVLKPNIKIALGVSGWTEVSMIGCNLGENPNTPIFRMSGDTSDLANFNKENFNTSWYVELDHYGNNVESISWDSNENKFVLNSNWFGEDGLFSSAGTATVTYDDVNNVVTVTYPLTVDVNGQTDKLKVNGFGNCSFGTNITKFEYYGELEQPLKPYVQETRAALSGKVNTSAITSSVTSASTDSEIPTAKAVFDAIPTGSTGGGKTISAGTNISVTTGETADTINCTLPIVDWGNNNIAFTDKGYGNGNHTLSFGDGAVAGSMYSMSLGNFTSTRGNYSVAIGYGGSAYANFSNAFGYYTVTNNNRETAQGVYNNSVSASTTFGDSGNTLFSVGNGTSSSSRHNAFEIRQNGDIYCSDGTNDVKLQDTITATTANTAALGGLSIVKLTQVEYDALTTKDSNTLYFVGDSNGYIMKIGDVSVN